VNTFEDIFISHKNKQLNLDKKKCEQGRKFSEKRSHKPLKAMARTI
jgi:hypothetical protein